MNRFAKKKREHPLLRELVLPVCFFALVAAMVILGVRDVGETTQARQLSSTEEAVRRAAVQCYAVEGQYPQNVAYLEEHYGLIIDHEKYIVHYMGFASNLMPDIAVLPLGGGEEAQ